MLEHLAEVVFDFTKFSLRVHPWPNITRGNGCPRHLAPSLAYRGDSQRDIHAMPVFLTQHRFEKVEARAPFG